MFGGRYVFVQLFPRNLIRFHFLQTRNLSTENNYLFSEVIHEIKIILIAPATLKSFKTFFTMTGSKRSHLLMILIYSEELDKINIKRRTNKLIKEKESRIATFRLY